MPNATGPMNHAARPLAFRMSAAKHRVTPQSAPGVKAQPSPAQHRTLRQAVALRRQSQTSAQCRRGSWPSRPIPCGHAAAADQEQARAVLGLPEGLFFAFVLSVGYPAYRPLAVIDRLNRRPFDEVVHRCRWGPPSASPAGTAYGANRVSARGFGNRGSTWQWCNGRLARELSMLAGLGSG